MFLGRKGIEYFTNIPKDVKAIFEKIKMQICDTSNF